MKLKLKAAVLAAIIGAGMAANATAATTIGNGKIYDVGKGSYSTAPGAAAADRDYCWAASGSDLLQYWQDTYYKHREEGVDTPNGVTERFDEPYGTRYLDIYEEVLEKGTIDRTGSVAAMNDWWFKGTAIADSGHAARPGSYTGLFGSSATTVESEDFSKPGFSATLREAFSVQGQAVGLSIMGYNDEAQSFVMLHAVTCWGYEENTAGDLTAVYLVDSDDSYFGAFRVEVAELQDVVVNVPLYGGEVPLGDLTVLSSDDDHGLYGSSMVYLRNTGVCTTYINTPESVRLDSVAPKSTAAANSVVLENVKFTGKETVYGSGVQFGDGKTAMIVTGEAGAGLTVAGQYEGGSGVTVAEGVLVSLDNLEITMHEDSGLVNAGKTYVHDGSAFLLYNLAMEGGAVQNSGYLEFKGCDEVVVATNAAFGDGGAVYNEGRISMRGNGSVLFMENASLMGGAADIYNAEGGVVSIADNGEVYFMSGAEDPSIVNRGELYLAVDKHQYMTFMGSCIDSREGGSTYIGKDAMGRYQGMQGSVEFVGFAPEGPAYTTVTAAAGADAADFYNVRMDAFGITGDSGATVAHAVIESTGSLTFSNVSMGDVVVSAAAGITLQGVTLNAANCVFATESGLISLDNAVINLADLSHGVNESGSLVYDLGSVFSGTVDGSFTLTGYQEAESYLFTSSTGTNFAQLCMDLLKPAVPEEETPVVENTPAVEETPVVENTPAVEETPVVDASGLTESETVTPAVLAPLQDPELALAVENTEADVTLGGADAGVALSNGLTQTVEAAAAATEDTLADLAESGVTLLPETLEMDAAGMEAMADALAGAEAAEGLLDQAAADQVKRATGKANGVGGIGRRPVMLAAGAAGPVMAVTGAAGSVPEPSTGIMALLAMAGLASRRRRK